MLCGHFICLPVLNPGAKSQQCKFNSCDGVVKQKELYRHYISSQVPYWKRWHLWHTETIKNYPCFSALNCGILPKYWRCCRHVKIGSRAARKLQPVNDVRWKIVRNGHSTEDHESHNKTRPRIWCLQETYSFVSLWIWRLIERHNVLLSGTGCYEKCSFRTKECSL